MLLNADFSAPVFDLPHTAAFIPSPTPGVSRRMLDRIGAEVARATSIVRYAPNASFPAHMHGGGEEFLVLDGLFLDEHAAYPRGSYVRNPIGTAHAPRSGPQGALLFVKLHQFHAADAAPVRIDTLSQPFREDDGPGRRVLPLHAYAAETVRLEQWEAGCAAIAHAPPGGLEALVLEGGLERTGPAWEGAPQALPAGAWVRLPEGCLFPFQADATGARLYVKSGALPPAAAGVRNSPATA
jgi:quercetin dioxygenase-like cupin family protein